VRVHGEEIISVPAGNQTSINQGKNSHFIFAVVSAVMTLRVL
jgi:hypothetical protein